MTGSPSPRVSRRQLLGITAGLGVASVAGVAAGQTAGGDLRWRFETGEPVDNSPTVDSGTLYVGTDSGVTALAAGVEGSSDGSRARLGTLGHPDDWRYADQELADGNGGGDTGGGGGDGGGDTDGTDGDGATDEASGDGLGPGFGAGATLAALGGLALLARRRGDGDSGSDCD